VAVRVWGRHRASILQRLGASPDTVPTEPPPYVREALARHGEQAILDLLAWAWRGDDGKARWLRERKHHVGRTLWASAAEWLPIASSWAAQQRPRAGPAPPSEAVDLAPVDPTAAREALVALVAVLRAGGRSDGVEDELLARELEVAVIDVPDVWDRDPVRVEAAWLGVAPLALGEVAR
jgi:hypothetical protein